MFLCANYDRCCAALPNCTVMHILIVQLLIQSPLSFMGDTYELFSSSCLSFTNWHFWGALDVLMAIATFATSTYIMPRVCDTAVELIVYYTGLVSSLICFVGALIAFRHQHFQTDKRYALCWMVLHTLWHTILPLACTYVIMK